MAFAPTRSGKGVGLVVPTLLSWTGSAVIHDIKGENWQLTAGWRSRFSHCLLFNPTDARSAQMAADAVASGAADATNLYLASALTTAPTVLGFKLIANLPAFAIVASSNAVNITDGLDGLSGGTLVFAFIGFMAIAALNTSPPQSNLAILCALIIGSLLGFL